LSRHYAKQVRIHTILMDGRVGDDGGIRDTHVCQPGDCAGIQHVLHASSLMSRRQRKPFSIAFQTEAGWFLLYLANSSKAAAITAASI
jgi:hypothetical protein